MIYFIVISAIIIFFILLYFLYLVRPLARKTDNPRLLCNYAHRGLHGKTVPENSLKAFELACEKGYGIELDVQLASDGTVMVFHDYTLKRMTGCEKKVCQLTADELTKLSLKESDQTIPTFKQVLDTVNGRVPILVELKGESLNTSLCEKAALLLKDYKGDYCIESFNPFLLRKMKKYLPNAFYGQLYTNVCKDKKKYSPLNILLTLMIFNFLAKPDFIAYNQEYRNNLQVRLTTKFYKATPFVWTIKQKEDMKTAEKRCECAIFEEQ